MLALSAKLDQNVTHVENLQCVEASSVWGLLSYDGQMIFCS
jgi:hypothetical protein